MFNKQLTLSHNKTLTLAISHLAGEVDLEALVNLLNQFSQYQLKMKLIRKLKV